MPGDTPIDTLLFFVRGIHFTATLSLGGVAAFIVLILDRPLESASIAPPELGKLRPRLTEIAWTSLGIAVATGALWLGLEAQAMSGRSMTAVLTEGVFTTALTRTHFGHVALARLIIAALLGVCLFARGRSVRSGLLLNTALLFLSALLTAAIAWMGHAAATTGGIGVIHLIGDAVHLLAAMAWLGALLPLALFLATVRKSLNPVLASVAPRIVRRFSIMGLISVAAILVSGTINTWLLAGTVPALLGTPYGQWLILKILFFIAMVGVAAVNRLRLTPRLSHKVNGNEARVSRNAVGMLKRNALIEAGFGIAIVLIVGLLGTLPPGVHTKPEWPLTFTHAHAH